MPGNIKLADAMRTLIVTIKNDGYELKSIAGKAFYGVSGIRGKVEGIPEYFPISLSVKDESNPVPKAELSKVQPGLDEQVSAQLTQISNADTSITSLASGLDKANADITRKTTSCLGTLTSRPIVELTDAANDVLYALFFRGALASGDLPAKSGAAELRSLGFAETGHVATKYQGEDYFTWLTPAGQAFAIEHLVKTRFGKQPANAEALEEPSANPGGLSINGVMVRGEIGSATHIGEALICGNTIEQETLSAVLVHYLPTTNLDKASEHAVKLASAVKASFIELGCSTGGYVSDRNTAPLIFGERMSESVIPASTIKLNADGEEKQVSTLTVRVEMDASSVLQSLDEVESAISKHLATVLDKALKPGGKIWSAIKNHR